MVDQENTLNALNDEEIDDVESDLNFDINKFSQAVIWGTDWTTETINNQMLKMNIDLSPSFQRRDAWDNKEKSRLIESLMLGLPVPPIILAESNKKRNSYIVIDGKQRLLSIRQFYAAKTVNQETNQFKVLKLTGLEILKKYNGFTYDSQDTTDEYNQLINALDNQPIRTIVIKNWPDESFLYAVFLRLNTGSKKLSSQELRQALNPGPFLEFLDRKTADSKALQKMLHNNGADKRMKDIELALRYYAFRHSIRNYTGNLKEFLDNACDEFNRNWSRDAEKYEQDFSDLETAIEFCFENIDPDNPFSRQDKTRPRFNRSLFELFTYYFVSDKIRNLVKNSQPEFKTGLEELYKNEEFNAATSFSTKNVQNVVKRFELFASMLNDLPSAKNISIPCLTLTPDNHIDTELLQH
jgi:hypothetical protein